MRLAKYWSRATVNLDGHECQGWGVTGVGWSDINPQDAHRVALERARRAASHLKAEEELTAWDYPYPDRPMREPVVDQLEEDGRVLAAVTRNGYGALVMNTAEAMFVDIDHARYGCMAALLGAKVNVAKHTEKTIAKLREFTDIDRRAGFRLYKICAGLRVLVTHKTFDPAHQTTADLMKALDADKRYTLLCMMQSCFRARLTPKPWRCGLSRPPGTFPYTTQPQHDAFEAWRKSYEHACQDYGVCELIDRFGSEQIDPRVQPILNWHDELTCLPDLPLA